MAAGVKTQIWNNQIKSGLLLLTFPCLVLLLTWLFMGLMGVFLPQFYRQLTGHAAYYSSDPVTQFLELAQYGLAIAWPWALGFVGVWYCIALCFYQPIINGITGATALDRKAAPRLYNIVENLCISRGLKVPALYIIDSPAMNAYASGLTQSSQSITVTQGLLDTLNDAELEAVIGHELTHIINHDVRLVIVSLIFAGMLTLLCDLFYRIVVNSLSGRTRIRTDGKAEGGAVAFVLIALIVFAIGRVLALAIRMALSRDREYMADAGSVELTKNPDALISALEKIGRNPAVAGISGDVSQMCIEDANGDEAPGWFSTHPPIHERIQALVMMGGRKTEEGSAPDSGPWSAAKAATPETPVAPSQPSANKDAW